MARGTVTTQPEAAVVVAPGLTLHWPEYLMEGAILGLFMISLCVCGTLLEYPGSPVHQAIGDPLVRRALMALAMGASVAALLYSSFGQRSGGHMNPAATLAYFRLGKTTTV